MNLVKEHNGVKIFVSIQGEFYCNANTNSNDYEKKTFVSTKLQSIEKAIDDFKEKDLQLLFDRLRENQKEINKLYEVQKELSAKAVEKLSLLRTVTVS
jgi:hypothetical protein